MTTHVDALGNIWSTPTEALEDFMADLPYLTDEEQESVFQFTRRDESATFNLNAIRRGVDYSGLHDRFEGDNYPVPFTV